MSATLVKQLRDDLGIGLGQAKRLAKQLCEAVRSDERRVIAAQIMAGFAVDAVGLKKQQAAEISVEWADALIEELNK